MIIAPEDEYGDTVSRRSRQSLSQQAYEQIRRKIVSLGLPPGAIVDEAALQNELGLGRTPIREALLRLSLEKLVTIVPRRGIFVTEIGITDLQRLFEVRLDLEALAVRLAVERGTDEHWARMEFALDSAAEADGDYEALIVIDEMCHQIIYEATDNKFLQDALVTLYALSLRLWYFFLNRIGDMQEVILKHRLMLEALQARDADRAVSLMTRHIRAFQEEVLSAMLGGTDAE
jgi:DNA-binding GntR family transcriptional regulator